MDFIRKHAPLLIALLVLWATLAIVLGLAMRGTDGNVVYVLDDPYIHMAIAKNLSQSGVWGVTEYRFTSSASSLLWPLLLALDYLLFGVNELAPLVLNAIFATLLVALAHVILIGYGSRPVFNTIVLLCVIFFSPLPTLVFSGHEHTLQALVALAFVYASADALSRSREAPEKTGESARPPWAGWPLALAPVVTMTRYEGLFLVFIVCVLLMARGRRRASLALGALGLLPIVVFGAIAMSKGWHFLPNSILMKGQMPDPASLKGVVKLLVYFAYKTAKNPHILALLLGTLFVFHFLYSLRKTIWDKTIVMMIIFVATTLLHMHFADTGYFYRYEAYLVCLGVVVLGAGIHPFLPETIPRRIGSDAIPQWVAVVLFVGLVVSLLAFRGATALIEIPQASKNIYEQHVQMGRFLKRFYEGKRVAMNDVGATNFYGGVDCLDLWGLASVEVLDASKEPGYRTEAIGALARREDARIAVLYEGWFWAFGGLPPEWIKVGEWKIQNNIVAGGEIVSWYAVDPSEEDNLIENLREFASELPPGVFQSGKYTQ